MPLSLLWKIVVVTALLFAPAMRSSAATDEQQAFRNAYFAETYKGDLAEAARLYEQVATSKTAPQELVKEAKVRLAGCREDMAAEDLARLMPPGTIAYAELRRPGQHLADLAGMLGLGGDPLANIGRPAYPVPEEPCLVIPRNPAISSAILDQLEKLGSVAVALTNVAPAHREPEGVVILYTPNAGLMRGVAATLAQFARADEPIGGFPTVRLACHGGKAVITFTNRLIVVGTGRDLVAGVVQRLSGQEGQSLADSPVFAEASAGRTNALLFAFVDVQKAWGEIVRRANETGHPVPGQLAVVQGLVDPAHMKSLALRLGTTSSGLEAQFVMSLAEGQVNMVYNLMRMPPMQGRALAHVPAGAAAVLAFGLNPDLTDAGAEDVMTKTQTIQSVTGLDIAREMFCNIREAAVFVLPPGQVQASPSALPVPDVALVTIIGDPARSQALWTYLLSLPGRFMGSELPEPEHTTISGSAVEAFRMPNGVTIFFARTEQAITVALTRTAMRAALQTASGGDSVLQDSALRPVVELIGDNTSVAALADVGRLVKIGEKYSPPGEAMQMRVIGSALSSTVAAIVLDESATLFRAQAELMGLPRADKLIDSLADVGLLSEREMRTGEQAVPFDSAVGRPTSPDSPGQTSH